MTVGALSADELRRRLAAGQLGFELGSLGLRITADLPAFAEAFGRLYADFTLFDPGSTVADVTLQLRRAAPGSWVWLANGIPTGKLPFGRQAALAEFEWAIHWATPPALAPDVAFHAAVVAHPSGGTVALVGSSGSGKSTLAAALASDGWMLVADEFLILDEAFRIVPMPGLITLKNQSIELIRKRGDTLRFGEVVMSSDRGTVTQVAAPRTAARGTPLTLQAVVLPTFVGGDQTAIERTPPTSLFYKLVEQSHNRHVLGVSGFRRLCRLASMPAWALGFGQLDDAVAAVRSVAGTSS